MATKKGSGSPAKHALLRTLPNKWIDITVNTVAVVDLAALGGSSLDLRGKWVALRAVGALAFARGTHDGSGGTDTLTSADGWVCAAGDTLPDFWIDPNGDTKITTVKVSGATALRIFYDSDVL